jgi:hypothetical protein
MKNSNSTLSKSVFSFGILAMILLLSVASSGTAQFVITSEDLPQGGTTYDLSRGTTFSLGELDVTGEEVTWDFSGIIELDEAQQTPSDIGDASFTALLVFNSSFNPDYVSDYFVSVDVPDVGIDLGLPFDGFNQFFATSGEFYGVTGMGISSGGFDLPLAYSDIEEHFPLPFSYGMTYEGTSAFGLDIPDTFAFSEDQSRSAEADGYGTLVLPDDTFEVLRVRTELTAANTISTELTGEIEFDREEVIYEWWAEGMGYPVLSITTAFGLPVNVTYYSESDNPDGISELVVNAPSMVYPTPATRGAEIHLEGVSSNDLVQLFDATGRELKSAFATGGVLKTAAWNTGTYFAVQGSQHWRIVIQ